ncbi:AAA family ATPase [Enterobacter sp. CGMCC 5087]|uniref:sigma-54 interaction domain-containing protein n=1 Tax=Enterobacter sp. CGMCC 5087 TaxID=2183878 RepID=UPI000D684C7C|nr:sigma-54 dependent transcriptional regulator [Enterobacter sp. CGMCC 5087]PWI77351.1 AAA family ATPase [Enterobacter sp. CGMCC 5087]
MLQVLQFAESLIQPDNDDALADWLLATLRECWQPEGIILGLCDYSGRLLACTGYHPAGSFHLVLPVDDFGHPLASVVHDNAPHLWETLHGGARTEHAGFRELLMTMKATTGLLALPVCDETQKMTGVLGLFDKSDALQRWSDSELTGQLLRLFTLQRSRLHQMQHNQKESQCLRDSLRRVTDEQTEHDRLTHLLASRLVGQSSAVQALRECIRYAAAHSLSVLIEGETGTGKEVVAQLVHECSSRAGQPLVALNCAAVPENLIESELFGWQKGAFTGAHAHKEGLIARANGGTLFLDEVGDMPLVMQAKLLRVLETRQYRPLGGDKEQYSDFRVVAATHHALRQRVTDGHFRQDLYHRLCQSELVVPPLRERPEDIPLLCRHFIAAFSERDDKRPGDICLISLRRLLGYTFPGNVRELRNMTEVACAHAADGQRIDIPGPLSEAPETCLQAPASEHDDYLHVRDLREAVQTFESGVIRSRLAFFRGDRQRVAESLNIPRRTLDHKCQKLERA